MKKKWPRTNFSGFIFFPTGNSQLFRECRYHWWKRKNIQRELWGIWGKQSTCSRLLCVFAMMPLIGAFHSFLTLEIPPGETLAFTLHVIFDCIISPSLPCLIPPHVSAGSPKSISFLPHRGQTVVGKQLWPLRSLLCCFTHTWFSKRVHSFSHMLCRWTLGCSCSWPVQHTHSNILTWWEWCGCQTHWKVKTSMQGGWVGRGLGLVTQKTASYKELN